MGWKYTTEQPQLPKDDTFLVFTTGSKHYLGRYKDGNFITSDGEIVAGIVAWTILPRLSA